MRLQVARAAAVVTLAMMAAGGGGFAAAQESGSGISQQDLFVKEGRALPRLPGLLVTREGTVLAVAQWRKNGAGDFGNPTDIILRRGVDGGATWEERVTLYDSGADWAGGLGPIVQDRETGRIFVSFVRIPVKGHGGERGFFDSMVKNWAPFYMVTSDDDGRSWSEPYAVKIEPDAAGNFASPGNCNSGIQLASGRLVLPSWSRPKEGDGWGHARAGVIYSDDHGKTWKVGAISPEGSNESTVAAVGPLEIYLNWRHTIRGQKGRGWSRSVDGGLTFAENGFHDELVNPTVHAGVACQAYDKDGDRDVLVFTNPIGPGRSHMALRVSRDAGRTWSVPRLIYEGSAAYSDVAVLPDGKSLCLYEADGYSRIRLAMIESNIFAEGN